MILILKNLPVGITNSEFKTFVNLMVDGAFEPSCQPIRKTKIMVQFDRRQGKFEFHGLVYCNGRPLGEITLGLFEGFLIKGHPIEIAEFIQRKPQQTSDVASQALEIIDCRRRVPSEELLIFHTLEAIDIHPAASSPQSHRLQAKPEFTHSNWNYCH